MASVLGQRQTVKVQNVAVHKHEKEPCSLHILNDSERLRDSTITSVQLRPLKYWDHLHKSYWRFHEAQRNVSCFHNT